MQLLYINMRYPHITNLMHTMMTISRGLGQSFNFGEGHIERSKRDQKNWEFFGLRQQEQEKPPPVGFLITYLNT